MNKHNHVTTTYYLLARKKFRAICESEDIASEAFKGFSATPASNFAGVAGGGGAAAIANGAVKEGVAVKPIVAGGTVTNA